MVIAKELKSIYPFESKYFEVGDHKLHYVDEGIGDVIFLIHGNPTWSFYYREIIKDLSTKYRVIALDHLGCGLSDKPDYYDYTLANRVHHLTNFINSFQLEKYSMMVHDWGGAIGFGHATNHASEIHKMIILNTAAFLSTKIPFSISLCKNKFFGKFLVESLNGFCFPATFMTTTKKLSPLVKSGYLAPYQNKKNRKAIYEFVKDIPLDSKHKSFDTLKTIESKLDLIQCPKLVLWGGRDFCFNDHFYRQWQSIYPDAKFKYYENAGHYVIEDEKSDTLQMINDFLE